MRSDSENWDQFGVAYDHADFGSVPSTYLIASTPRSGSHFLGHLLFATGEFGSPLEYLHPRHLEAWQSKLGAATRQDTFLRLFRRRTSSNGWFGVKAHWAHFAPILEDEPLFTLLNFQHYIRITRRDTLGQAISLVIARQTGSAISFQARTAEPRYSFSEINTALLWISAETSAWDRFFASTEIEPLTVEYENLKSNTDETLRSLREKFGLSGPLSFRRKDLMPSSQSLAASAHWRQKYMDDYSAAVDASAAQKALRFSAAP